MIDLSHVIKAFEDGLEYKKKKVKFKLLWQPPFKYLCYGK